MRNSSPWTAGPSLTFIETGPVKHDAKIVVLTATPKDPAVTMNVHPEAGLEVHIAETGIVGYRIEAVRLLGMLHDHVRTMVDVAVARLHAASLDESGASALELTK